MAWHIVILTFTYCWHPGCLDEHNPIDAQFCQQCGSRLKLQDRYRAIQRLGRTTFLAIDLATTPPAPCVVKRCRGVNSNWTDPELIFPPQIPAVRDYIKQGEALYIVHGFIAGKTLETLLVEQQLLPAAVWQILAQVLPVLQWLHSYQLIHGDIQPRNIIQMASQSLSLDQPQFRLVDFAGVTKVTSNPLDSTPATLGSATYAAPEQIQGQPVYASDLYSLGVTCIHALTGIHPFSLMDGVNPRWAWRHYWLPNKTNYEDKTDRERLAEVLDQLIEPDLSQRCLSAETMIERISLLRGEKITRLVSSPVPRWTCATLLGHQGLFAGVSTVAIAPDQTMLASGSQDKTIRLWDLETAKECFRLQGHSHFVQAIAFHPQQQTLLASGSRDRTVQLWDLQQRQAIRTLIGHGAAVNAVAFSPPDGQMLVSASADKTVKLWNPDTEELITTLVGHRLAVNAIAFSPVAPLLVSASADSTIRVWDCVTWEAVHTLVGHTAAVTAVAVAPDGKIMASGSQDRTIRLWDTDSWQCIRILSGHAWMISALAFSNHGKVLVSSSWDKTLKLWCIDTGKTIDVLSGHTDSVTCVAIAADGQVIVSGSQDHSIKIWKPQRKMGNLLDL